MFDLPDLFTADFTEKRARWDLNFEHMLIEMMQMKDPQGKYFSVAMIDLLNEYQKVMEELAKVYPESKK